MENSSASLRVNYERGDLERDCFSFESESRNDKPMSITLSNCTVGYLRKHCGRKVYSRFVPEILFAYLMEERGMVECPGKNYS